MNLFLTQHEADAFLALEKYYTNAEQYYFPSLGKSIEIPLHSKDKKEMFSLDISSGKISLQKHTLQTRVRKTLILARLDISGPSHRNPDGKECPCPSCL